MRAAGALAVLCAALVAVSATSVTSSLGDEGSVPAAVPPDFSSACGQANPYLVTTCYRPPGYTWAPSPIEAAVVAFRDTPADEPQYLVATHADVGAVYGLAFSGRENAVYAAAFHTRGIEFGPGGPGAIYRIDMGTGTVAHAITVPDAGPDTHDLRSLDRAAARLAGRTSLGDLDVGDDESDLFVVNLNNRRIYRFALPSGRLLGSFAHGASLEPWAEEARPFGLAVRQGRVYHSVVRSGERSLRRADLALHVYSSLPDGTDLGPVGSVALDYARGSATGRRLAWGTGLLTWLPWRDNPATIVRPETVRVHPMPMSSDIAFDADGNMALGLLDRMFFMAVIHRSANEWFGYGGGDVLWGAKQGDRWSIDAVPEHFDDNIVDNSEGTTGGLAAIADQGLIVASGWSPGALGPDLPGVLWFDAASGRKARREAVCQLGGAQPRAWVPPWSIELAFADDEWPAVLTGDVETLCVVEPTPTTTSTATATPSPTATRTPAPTMTTTTTTTKPPTFGATPSVTPTASPTPRATKSATATPAPLHLPLAVRERCDPEHKRADVALVIDTSSSMAGRKLEDAKAAAAAFVRQMDLAPGRDQVAVVRYDTTADVVCRLTNARAVIEAAIRNLTSRSGTHIDKGLRLALAELQSPRHLDRNLPVMILLTDGVQTGTPGEELRAAVEVRAAGARLYTIGLGADADGVALREMAGHDARYRFAPDSADLARIYGEIARDIVCPAPEGGFWPGR